MKITFNNNNFRLNSDGSIFWLEESCLILGDMHLEKGTSYIKQGNFLPPYDTIETLSKLLNSLVVFKIRKLILLGDIFHDNFGYNRLNDKEKKIFNSICNTKDIIWINGNHDKNFTPRSVRSYNKYKLKNLTFCHITNINKTKEISGHYHPKATFYYNSIKISKPCFIVDRNKIILPAYGSYAGGLNIRSEVLQRIFNKNFNVYALGNKTVIPIKNKYLI